MVERGPKTTVAPKVGSAPHRRDRRQAQRENRQGSPTRSRYRIASTIRRSHHLRGRPTRQGAGKNGRSSAHSASGKSLGKARSARAYCARVVSVHIVELRKFVAKPRGSKAVHRIISGLDSRQINPLTLLNLISDQALRYLRAPVERGSSTGQTSLRGGGCCPRSSMRSGGPSATRTRMAEKRWQGTSAPSVGHPTKPERAEAIPKDHPAKYPSSPASTTDDFESKQTTLANLKNALLPK